MVADIDRGTRHINNVVVGVGLHCIGASIGVPLPPKMDGMNCDKKTAMSIPSLRG